MSDTVDFFELAGFTPKQLEFTTAANVHKFILVGGARGPGKSYWLRWYLLLRLLEFAERGITGVRSLMACEDYPTLYERQISKVIQEFPDWLGTYWRGEYREFRLHDIYGGGVIAFRNLNKYTKYKSAEFADIAIDEISHNSMTVFNGLRGSLRWPNIPDNKFIAASNPSPNWVRTIWIEKILPENMRGREDEFCYVPGLPKDNPHLTQSYWDELESQEEHIKKAWLFGDWYAGVSGLVHKDFTADNITRVNPYPNLPIELAIDEGFVEPRAVLFIQKTPMFILVFDEIYITQQLEEDTIRDIFNKCANYGKGDRGKFLKAVESYCLQHGLSLGEIPLGRLGKLFVGAGFSLPSLAVVSHEAIELRKRLRKAGITPKHWLTKRVKGSTRKEAIKLARARVKNKSVLIHSRCYHTLDEIRAGYKYPEEGVADPESPIDAHDHAMQALEGWLWYHFGGRREEGKKKARSHEGYR